MNVQKVRVKENVIALAKTNYGFRFVKTPNEMVGFIVWANCDGYSVCVEFPRQTLWIDDSDLEYLELEHG